MESVNNGNSSRNPNGVSTSINGIRGSVRNIRLKAKAVIPDDEKIYRYQETSSVNAATLVLLFITIFSAYYVSVDKNKQSTNDDIKLSSQNITNTTIPEKIVTEETISVNRRDKYKMDDEPVNNVLTNDNIVQNNTNNVLTDDTKPVKVLDVPAIKKRKKRDGITNTYDKKIRTHIYDGEILLKKGKFAECVSFFETLLTKYSLSPRIIYGHAQCLHKLAEQMRSNAFLLKAIESYGEVANKPDVPIKLVKISLLEQAKQYIFLGHTRKAIVSLHYLSKLIPEDTEVLNELGISYLILGSNKLALRPFEDVLLIDKNNGIAKVHIGFILKAELKYKEAIPYLLEGIRSGEKAAIDSRFYFHLGDAYRRLGQVDEAWKVYHEAAEKKLFLSAEQRSTYNAETKLLAQPWWTRQETGYTSEIKLLEYHWKTIRDEALSILDRTNEEFPLENENLTDKGDWRQFDLYSQGKKKTKNCAKVPKTCAIIDKIPIATRNQRGQIKFSVMQPGTHIWPHTGPTNCRLRGHLGLVIPKEVHIRVGSETRTWQNGKVIIIDDSFEHEVWHNGTTSRLILIIDFWHPDLPKWERDSLSPI